MRWSGRASLALEVLLWLAAFASVIDDVPRTVPERWHLDALSAANRHDFSLSARERGLPWLRRGTLALPDLYPLAWWPEAGRTPSEAALEVELPAGSWLDVLVDLAPPTEGEADHARAPEGQHRLLRLSRVEGASWSARVDDAGALRPVEEPLRDVAPCLGDPVRLQLRFSPDSVALRAGECGPWRLARTEPAAGIGISSGLGGLRVTRFSVTTDGPAGRVTQEAGRIPAATRIAASMLPAALLAVPWTLLLRRRRRHLPTHSKGPPLATVALLGPAALPVLPWSGAGALVVVAVGLSLARSRAPAPPARKHARGRGADAALALLALACLPAWAIAMRAPTPPVEPPFRSALVGDEPWAWNAAQLGPGRTVALSAELTGAGAAVVELDAPAIEPGQSLSPALYPDLGTMSPTLLIERGPGGLVWHALIGDVVVRSGRTESPGPMTLVPGSGGLGVWSAGRLLARVPGVPPRPGHVRVRRLAGESSVALELRAVATSRPVETYAALGPTVGLLAGLWWLARRFAPTGRLGRSLFARPLMLVLAVAAGFAATGRSTWLLVLWAVFPYLVVFGALAALPVLLWRQRARPVTAGAAALALLLAPSAVLFASLVPSGWRLLGPWPTQVRSEHAMRFADPLQRLFNDTAQTGRYRYGFVPTDPPAGLRRIVVLGGSQTFGEGFAGADPKSIWTHRLHERDPSTEVVNLAVQGSTLASQVSRLEVFAASHSLRQVGAIVAVFGPNDAAFFRGSAARYARLRDHMLDREIIPGGDLCGMLASCSAPRFLWQTAPLFLGRGNGTIAERRAGQDQALSTLSELAWRWRIPLLLVREPQQCDLVPCRAAIAPYDYTNGFDWARDRIERMVAAGRAAQLDARPCLRAARAELPFFDAAHFAESGHRAMAACIGPALDRLLEGGAPRPSSDQPSEDGPLPRLEAGRAGSAGAVPN